MTPGQVLLLVLSGGYLLHSARNAWLNAQAQRWPSVPGRILTSELHPDGDALDLVYEYSVGDRRYDSTRLCYVQPGLSAAEAARQFPAGAQVPVFHDPRDPYRATLLTTPPRLGLGDLVITVLFIAAVLSAA